MTNNWLYSLVFFSLLACASSKQPTGQLCGTIQWQSGNKMPSPDRPTASPKGVAREIFIYERTKLSQVQVVEGFIHSMPSQVIAKTQSDAQGHFCLALPAGKYSVLVNEKEKGLWSNQFDGEGNIFPIEITAGATTNIAFLVNYKASY